MCFDPMYSKVESSQVVQCALILCTVRWRAHSGEVCFDPMYSKMESSQVGKCDLILCIALLTAGCC